MLARRMRWNPRELVNGRALLYELLLVTKDGAFVGVRDHTAIVDPAHAMAVVHLSHNLVAPDWRRGGIAGWLRALPISAARSALAAQGLPRHVANFPDRRNGARRSGRRSARDPPRRLWKGRYRKLAGVPYHQPDFRAPEEIDAGGGPRPLPLSLLVREVGREAHATLPAGTVRHIVESLYHMYGAEFRECDMAPVWENFERFPRAGEVPLVPPIQP